MKNPNEPGRGQVRAALKDSKSAIVMIVIFSFFANLLLLTGPLFMLQIYDRVLTSGSIPTLLALAGLVLILFTLYGILEYVRGRILLRLGRTIEENLADKVFHMISYHALRGNKDVHTRPAQDLATIRQFTSGPGPFAFLDLPWVPVYLFVIYLLHFLLGAAATVAVIVLAVLMVINSAVTGKYLVASQKEAAKASNLNEEARRNVEVSHVLGMLSRLADRWRKAQFSSMDNQTIAADRGAMVSTASKTIRMMFQSGILALGAYLAVKQEISPGTMIAASIIMARALAPVEQVVAQWRSFAASRDGWKRLDEMLAKTPLQEEKMPLPTPQGHLSVEGLVCYAPGNPEPLLQRVSFELPPGSGLGIIGPTGAGKTTLARALIGSWAHFRGNVRIDGAALDQWDSDQLGKNFGYLSQDVELFEGSIGENISRFEPEADPKMVVEAAQAAIVHELVLQFPDGYNTMVGERGVKLSAGQRQRIGLARALYGNPKIIVLDEPNANLDAQGEQALVHAIAKARQRGGTVIVIAHRPSAIASLNLVMMLKGGKVVAFGPKDEILSKILAKPVDGDGRPSGLTSSPDNKA